MNKYFAPAIAISTALLVLLGYFLPIPLLQASRIVLLQWAVVLAAVAILVGIMNMLAVHVKKVREKEKGGIYSLFLIASLLITFVVGVVLGPDHAIVTNLFTAVIVPVEKSLFAIMAIILIYAGIRLLRFRRDLMAILFLLTAIVVMLGTAPLPFFQIPLLGDFIRPTVLLHIFSASGARGILIGLALGALLTGIRVLIGADRPYGGNN